MPHSLEVSVGQKLTHLKARIATAESCTGGLLAHRLTNVSGSSSYFEGGLVTYSNEAKEKFLGVNHDDLVANGAVSEVVARQMAEGIRDRMGTDWGVGITGIAGPTGGTPEKPVGLVFIAVAGPDGTQVTQRQFPGARDDVKRQTAEKALELLEGRLT